jgi:hypothetical protein
MGIKPKFSKLKYSNSARVTRETMLEEKMKTTKI